MPRFMSTTRWPHDGEHQEPELCIWDLTDLGKDQRISLAGRVIDWFRQLPEVTYAPEALDL